MELRGGKRSWVSNSGRTFGWCIRKGCSVATHMDCVDDRFPTECVGGSLCVVGLEPGAQQGKFDGTTTTAGARSCTGPMARTCICQQQLGCRGEEKRETWSVERSIDRYAIVFGRFVPSIWSARSACSTGPSITTWILFRSKGGNPNLKNFPCSWDCSPRPPSSQRCQRYCPAAPARRSAKGQPRSWYHRPSAPRYPPSATPVSSTARVRPGVLARRAVGHGNPHPFVRRTPFQSARDGAHHHLGACRPLAPGWGCVV